MSKHFIIVPAHLDKKYKEPIAINLLKQLSDIPDISICFCSHHKNIPDKIYEYSDYVIFDKNNPVGPAPTIKTSVDKFFIIN